MGAMRLMRRRYLADHSEYRPHQQREVSMKKILVVGMLALVAACGSSSKGVSVGTSGDDGGAAATAPADGSEDTASGTS
jgi:hypothetical protein